MWTRIRIDDVRAIVHYLGALVTIVGAIMAAPLVVALLARETAPATWFAVSMGVTVSAGTAMSMVRPSEPGLTRKQAVILTGLVWLVTDVFAALPFFLSGETGGYFESMFNCMSYLTGTGMIISDSPVPLPVSLTVWSALLTIVGAQGIILVAMGLGTVSSLSGASSLFSAEGHSDVIGSRVADTSRFAAVFMGVFVGTGTLLCTAMLFFDQGFTPGFSLLHAFSLSVNAVATAGATIPGTGVSYYHSMALNVILTMLMFSGSFSFALYFFMVKKGPREFFRDIETRTILGWLLVATVVLSIAFAADPRFGQVSIFLDKGLFNLASAITGTGFSTMTSAQVSSVASSAVVFTLVLAMSMGGATSSTTGGFKAIRLALLVRTVASEVRRSLVPPRAREAYYFHHFGERLLTPEMSRSIMLVILLYVVSFAGGAVLGVAHGNDPVAAVMESVSCTANCGFSSAIVGPGMPVDLQVCYYIQMFAGRLEFVTLLTTIASIGASVASAASGSRARRALAEKVPARLRRAWLGEGRGDRRGHDSRELERERSLRSARPGSPRYLGMSGPKTLDLDKTEQGPERRGRLGRFLRGRGGKGGGA